MDQSNGALLQEEFTLYSWSTKEVKKKKIKSSHWNDLYIILRKNIEKYI